MNFGLKKLETSLYRTVLVYSILKDDSFVLSLTIYAFDRQTDRQTELP